MQQPSNECLAVMGSMTQAMRAAEILSKAAIPAEVVKMDPSKSRRGCAFALSYSCFQDRNVRTVLQNAGIRVREYVGTVP